MKKRTIFSILIITFMTLSLTVFSGCDIIDRILAEEPAPPGYYDEPAEPEPEPEPEDVAPPESDEPELSAWEQRLRSLPMAIGFANEEGNKLIHVFYKEESDEDAEPAEEETDPVIETDEEINEDDYAPNNFFAETGFDPDMFSLAIGPFGDIWPIAFAYWQDEKYGNNGREIASNFDRLPGFVYSQKDWKLTKNKTFLMTEMGTLLDTMLAIGSPVWRGNMPPMEDETVESIEKYMERKVEWGKILAITKIGDGLIGLVKFERQGDDMLFSIVYMDDKKTLFWNNPAVYDEDSTWRVDAGEEPGQFEPLVLARFEEGLMLMLIWTAPEGDKIVILYEEDGAFKQAEGSAFDRVTAAQ